MISYLKDLRLNEDYVLSSFERKFLTSQAVLDRIDNYQTSTPTGPSPGRIYSRRMWWRNGDKIVWGDWYVFIVCHDVFDKPKTQLHYPYKVVLTDA